MNDLAIQEQLQSKLTPAHLQQLVGFTDARELLDNLDRFSWTGSTEIEEILSIAHQNENLSAKLSAIKYLREVLYSTLETSGLLVKATRSMKGPDGETLTLSADLVAASLSHKPKGEPTNVSEPKPEIPKDNKTSKCETIGTHKPPREDLRNLFPGLSRPTEITPISSNNQ